MTSSPTDHLHPESIEADRAEPCERRSWYEPKLERRETLPRVTNAFAGTFLP